MAAAWDDFACQCVRLCDWPRRRRGLAEAQRWFEAVRESDFARYAGFVETAFALDHEPRLALRLARIMSSLRAFDMKAGPPRASLRLAKGGAQASRMVARGRIELPTP